MDSSLSGRWYRHGLARGLAWSVVAATLSLTLRRSLVEIRGPSMEPTLWPGDRLVTVPASMTRLRVGQIVVLDDPETPGHRIVKRITRIDDRHVEVHGDDPARSTDSARFGPVERRAVRRVAVTRWPEVRSPLTRAVSVQPSDGRSATTSSSGSSSPTSPEAREP